MKNVEIERKFLVRKKDLCLNLSKYNRSDISQGFIYIKPAIRIRKIGDKYTLTIKTKPPKEVKAKNDLARTEYEIEIPKKCYNYLLKFCKGRIIKKTRYYIPHKQHVIELDIFKESLKGLIYAEIEFNSVKKAEKFKPLGWFYKEVTGIEKYKNTQLSICKNVKNVIEY
jgi:CYTH domain-containing protein